MIGEVFTPFTAVKSRRTFGLNHNTESLLKGLYQSCTSWHCNFSPFFCKTAQSSVRLHRDQAWTALFKSSLKHYVGLRSELWLGRSATFTSSTLNHFWVPLSVCFGSTSCWKINLLPSHRSLAHWIRLSSKISRYFAAFISPSTFSSLPGPAAWCCRHHAPQSGMVCLRCLSAKSRLAVMAKILHHGLVRPKNLLLETAVRNECWHWTRAARGHLTAELKIATKRLKPNTLVLKHLA